MSIYVMWWKPCTLHFCCFLCSFVSNMLCVCVCCYSYHTHVISYAFSYTSIYISCVSYQYSWYQYVWWHESDACLTCIAHCIQPEKPTVMAPKHIRVTLTSMLHTYSHYHWLRVLCAVSTWDVRAAKTCSIYVIIYSICHVYVCMAIYIVSISFLMRFDAYPYMYHVCPINIHDIVMCDHIKTTHVSFLLLFMLVCIPYVMYMCLLLFIP